MRDLNGKDVAWYRFTETPGKIYGPRDMAFVFRAYSLRATCEVSGAGPDGQPSGDWFPATDLRSRLKSQAVQPRQLKRLAELGIVYDPETIDKIGALELIEMAELRQPADVDDIEDARSRGAEVHAGMTRAQLARALVPIEAAEEADDDERERQEELAERRQRLKKQGVTVDATISESSLQEIEDAVELYTMALEEAREWGLEAARARGRRPTSAESAIAEAALLESWLEAVKQYDEGYVEHVGRRQRPPSEALMRQLKNQLFSLMADGRTPADIGQWVVETARAIDGERAGSKSSSGPSRSPHRAPTSVTSRASQPSTRSERGMGYIVMAGLLIVVLMVAAVISG